METMIAHRMNNNRGVALLIALLVTALLIALIFEFAYATRISLQGALNFRDSQRAYFLAKSSIAISAANYQTLREQFPQREFDVPILSTGDAKAHIAWEDESGKIAIGDLSTNSIRRALLRKLFENKGIDRNLANKIIEGPKIGLLTELHQFLNDEDFGKVFPFLTLSTINNININDAPEDVLLSLYLSPETVETIIKDRNPHKITIPNLSNYAGLSAQILTDDGKSVSASSAVTADPPAGTAGPSSIVKFYSRATVGGYTKTIEAVINTNNPKTPLYWRTL